MRTWSAKLAVLLVTTAVAASLAIPGPTATAGTPGKWTDISKLRVSLINEPGVLRLDNGNLLVVYERYGQHGDSAMGYTTLRPDGSKADQGALLAEWDRVTSDPKPIRISGTHVSIVFSGVRDRLTPGSPYDSGAMYSLSGGADGTGWALDSTGLSQSEFAYGSFGTSAVTLPGETPVAAYAVNKTIRWHEGFDFSIPAAAPDNKFTHGSCCLYNPTLARDDMSGKTYIGWYSNGDKNGQWTRRILPTTGPPRKAPHSTDSGSSVSPDQAVAMTNRSGGGIYLAYCRGYPHCVSIALWKVGAKQAMAVPNSRGADTIAIARGTDGRLWVVWDTDSESKVHAVHTDKSVAHFGAVRTIRLPEGSLGSYRLAAEGSTARTVDVVVNNADGLHHIQIEPGLKVSATPRRFDGDRRTTVAFTVTDAGAALKNARVEVLGKSDRTNANGIARITFGSGTHAGNYQATATLTGFYRGTVAVRVTK